MYFYLVVDVYNIGMRNEALRADLSVSYSTTLQKGKFEIMRSYTSHL